METIQISKDVLARLKPILTKLLADKVNDAYRHLSLAAKAERGEAETGIDATTYLEWQEQEARDANTLLAAMYAMYGEKPM